ncbi:alcohol dehydrogenase [Pseudohoeflea suaedae]|uniref:Alcohol dehydrogenase n=1 Tax=Pseudohoeflea suaedae TaxID=877384 RepID=A0A4R5PIH0_9HYPH|nr:zinc-dependent alcohol dehydrogenase family protein [Pseudohoeflea suaedae]TDH35027.1 alcohol dehydrogenase [Pseudohoeflea suaedae]
MRDPVLTRRAFVYDRFGPPLDVLSLAERPMPELAEGRLRVSMSLVPVNPSDLIPVSGAYRHRITLPGIAGYEGVGRVVAAEANCSVLIGRRVLPLRGEGTWQTMVDCEARYAVPVPDDILADVAARAYINPFTALIMLKRWPVHGRHVLLTGAGSSCASYIGRWALEMGAASVKGVYRSESRIEGLKVLGIEPIHLSDQSRIEAVAKAADVTFDALGGSVATRILAQMGAGATFIGYGLLSGQPVLAPAGMKAQFKRFHLRDHLAALSADEWQSGFAELWPRLRHADLPDVRIYPLSEWRSAIAEAGRPGGPKPLIDFTSD